MLLFLALIVAYALRYLIARQHHNLVYPAGMLLHATASLYIAVSAVAAFTLARHPPRVDAFEPNEWRLVGAFIFVTGMFYALYEIARVFAMRVEYPKT